MSIREEDLYFSNLRSYFLFHKGLFFILLCALNAIAAYIYQSFVLTDDLYYQTYGERVALANIDAYLRVIEEFSWSAYVFIPLVLLLKISFTAFCLNVGTLIAKIEIGFGKLFRIALVAEIVFVLANLIRAWWLSFSEPETLIEVQFFYPLSLINFFTPDTIKSWFAYPLITANLFELAYMLVLALGLHWAAKRSYAQSLGVVAASYGTGLLIWVVFIVFLSINLS